MNQKVPIRVNGKRVFDVEVRIMEDSFKIENYFIKIGKNEKAAGFSLPTEELERQIKTYLSKNDIVAQQLNMKQRTTSNQNHRISTAGAK
jgi:hypothetical protein